jgi:AcrR family transcriptional regulator
MVQPEMQPKRRYELKERARKREDTRRRITEAAVELHGTVGPARTTIKEVAERAGVERVTVYRHFPDDAALFEACSSHWAERNPPPAIEPWRAVDDPEARLRVALAEVYAWYAGTEPMLTNVTRDSELMPALAAVGERRRSHLRAAEDLLAEGWDEGEPEFLRAALGHALDFRTWRSLVREQGLDAEDAVELMARSVRCAARRR